ncbi:hypothetical protein ROHU_004140 [Labeo rohita]|uniref:Uncharacterized protein n=1 Tax=Labeo rohita TaxID=84645 RepID=A0A498NQX7_LABRO|nr:hypothetical protein ROHU_004140 [Labeo rohita]
MGIVGALMANYADKALAYMRERKRKRRGMREQTGFDVWEKRWIDMYTKERNDTARRTGVCCMHLCTSACGGAVKSARRALTWDQPEHTCAIQTQACCHGPGQWHPQQTVYIIMRRTRQRTRTRQKVKRPRRGFEERKRDS